MARSVSGSDTTVRMYYIGVPVSQPIAALEGRRL
jgi:hypothetical protein